MQWCHWLLLSIQGGGGVFVIVFGFRMTWRIMQILEGVMVLWCPTAATLSQETKVALFYLSSLAPKFFTARSRVLKQSFFQSLGTICWRVNKAHWLRWISPSEFCMILVIMQKPKPIIVLLFIQNNSFSFMTTIFTGERCNNVCLKKEPDRVPWPSIANLSINRKSTAR